MKNVVYKIKDVAKIYNGSTPSSKVEKYYNGNIIWITPKDLSNQKNKYINQGEKNITDAGYKSCSTTLLPIGTILLSSRAPIGLLSIASVELCTNQGFKNIISNKNRLDNEYLYYYLKLKVKELNRLGGGTTFKELSKTTIELYKICIPENVCDQQKTAAVLSSLDEKIELNNRINSELEAMAKMLYDYWFVQFDFPDKNGKPYKSSGGKMIYNKELKREIPECWEVKIINDFIKVKDGTHDSPKPQNAGYTLITSKNLLKSGLDFKNANFISEKDYININKRSQVETGDILFSMIGSIGVIYKVEEENINFAIKNVALYKTSHKPKYKNYIYQYLKSFDMQKYMGKVISGSIQKFIGLGSLRNMPLLFNNNIILEFNKKTNQIYSKLENNKQQNKQLTQLRDWLLPMLMNGQASVN